MPRGIPASVMSLSNESTCRPNALRRTVMSMPPNVSWPATPSASRSASMIIPAQDPNAGIPPAIRLRSGSSMSKATASFHIVVDSPPGMISPSTAVEFLRAADRDGGRTGVFERAQMLGDIPLQGEHPDIRHRVHPSSGQRDAEAAQPQSTMG